MLARRRPATEPHGRIGMPARPSFRSAGLMAVALATSLVQVVLPIVSSPAGAMGAENSVQPPAVAARWKLNDAQVGEQSISSVDDGPFSHDLTLSSGAHVDSWAGWVGDPPGGLVLDGAGDYAATSGPVIHTDQSFTVAGWVETPARPTRNAAIFSQEGSVNSAFTLRYAPDPTDPEEAGGYQLDMPDNDAVGAAHQVTNHNFFQSVSDWDHVAIVYDASAHQIRLYVNGQLDQSGSTSTRNDTVAFDATGPFQVGRTKTDGVYGEYWPGVIDDVWAFSGVLNDTQIAQLAGGAELPTDQFN